MIGHDDERASFHFRVLDPAPAADRWLEESDETFDDVAAAAPASPPADKSEEMFAESTARPAGSDERLGESDEVFDETPATPTPTADPSSVVPAAVSDRVVDPEIGRLREEAASRIAVAERMELEALARRRAVEDRHSEAWATEQQRRFTERLDAMLDAEAAHIAERRLTEGDRIASWGRAEHERIEKELGGEEQRFHDRLLGQLEEFEFQLGERLREQEERIGRWVAEAERIVETRTGSRRSEERRDPA